MAQQPAFPNQEAAEKFLKQRKVDISNWEQEAVALYEKINAFSHLASDLSKIKPTGEKLTEGEKQSIALSTDLIADATRAITRLRDNFEKFSSIPEGIYEKTDRISIPIPDQHYLDASKGKIAVLTNLLEQAQAISNTELQAHKQEPKTKPQQPTQEQPQNHAAETLFNDRFNEEAQQLEETSQVFRNPELTMPPSETILETDKFANRELSAEETQITIPSNTSIAARQVFNPRETQGFNLMAEIATRNGKNIYRMNLAELEQLFRVDVSKATYGNPEEFKLAVAARDALRKSFESNSAANVETILALQAPTTHLETASIQSIPTTPEVTLKDNPSTIQEAKQAPVQDGRQPLRDPFQDTPLSYRYESLYESDGEDNLTNPDSFSGSDDEEGTYHNKTNKSEDPQPSVEASAQQPPKPAQSLTPPDYPNTIALAPSLTNPDTASMSAYDLSKETKLSGKNAPFVSIPDNLLTSLLGELDRLKQQKDSVDHKTILTIESDCKFLQALQTQHILAGNDEKLARRYSREIQQFLINSSDPRVKELIEQPLHAAQKEGVTLVSNSGLHFGFNAKTCTTLFSHKEINHKLEDIKGKGFLDWTVRKYYKDDSLSTKNRRDIAKAAFIMAQIDELIHAQLNNGAKPENLKLNFNNLGADMSIIAFQYAKRAYGLEAHQITLSQEGKPLPELKEASVSKHLQSILNTHVDLHRDCPRKDVVENPQTDGLTITKRAQNLAATKPAEVEVVEKAEAHNAHTIPHPSHAG